MRKKSLNFHTPAKCCTVKYQDLDYAVNLKLICALQLEQDSPIFYSKIDPKSAFRIVPCKPDQFRLLLMKLAHPITGEVVYLVDKNLSFGASISCKLFQTFSDSLQHLAQYLIGHPNSTVNYLDDFLFISESEETCNAMVRTFLLLCERIGCPVSLEKTEWASKIIIFLGILIDGERKTLAVPQAKRIKALNLINWALSKKCVTIHFIQKLTGTLNFINKAIVPGRAFTRKMYLKLRLCDREGNKLKQYHHVRLDQDFLNDCAAWKIFLEDQNAGKLSRPFID